MLIVCGIMCFGFFVLLVFILIILMLLYVKIMIDSDVISLLMLFGKKLL